MRIKELRNKLKNSRLFGVIDLGPIDQSRDVIVQIQTGWKKVPYDDYEIPVYEYREIGAVGTLFHKGEFKVVIAVGDE